MPQTPLPNVGYNYEHTLGADDWKNSYDSNWVRADSVGGQPFVLDHDLAAEPASPAVGDAYLLPAGALTGTNWGSDTGAVADAIALYTNVPGQADASPWLYHTPREGWSVYDRASNVWRFYDGARWIARGGPHWATVTIGDTAGNFTPTVADHANALLVLSAAFDEVNDALNVPANATQPFPVGTRLTVVNRSGGDVDVVDEAAVAWEGEDASTLLIPDDGTLELQKTATDTWRVVRFSAYGLHNTDLTGFTANPNTNLRWSREGRSVSMEIETANGTSNATTMSTATALPVHLRPVSDQIAIIRVQDSGAGSIGVARVNTSGIIDFFVGVPTAAFTASGTKGVDQTSFSYVLH